MKNAPKPDHLSLDSLLSRLREGHFVIPDFQREFEWEPKDILELMRSLFLDYYIGSLLLWKGSRETFDALACEALNGFDGRENRQHIVLDGQQRLSAMYYAFMAPPIPAPNKKSRYLYFIRIDKWANDEPDEAFEYDWTSRGINLLASSDKQYEERLFPLATIGDSRRFAIPNWFQGYDQFWKAKRQDAHASGRPSEVDEAERSIKQGLQFCDHLDELLTNYQVAYIELDEDLDIDKICDTFTRINTRGIRLDIFDLMNALLRPKGVNLKKMWREVEPDLEFIKSGNANVYVLQVMSLLVQGYCSPKYIYYLLPGAKRAVRGTDGSLTYRTLISDGDDFKRRWSESVKAIKYAISRLRNDYGAISPRFLPYNSIVPALSVALQAANTAPSSSQPAAFRKVQDWYWASVFTNRYSGAVESTTSRDVLDVTQWIKDDDAEPHVISEFSDWLRDLNLRDETRTGRATYKGVLNLLVKNKARDWVNDAQPMADDVDDHHIIPASWGRANDLGSWIDSILNRTLLSKETNRVIIQNHMPSAYLRDWITDQDEGRVREILHKHMISDEAFKILRRDPFGRADYDDFLAKRQDTIQEAIHGLLARQVDISPKLRDLDSRIEAIEVELRHLIDQEVDGDEGQLPGHLRARIGERIKGALRTQPGLADELKLLSRRLEYADLGEIQGVIVGKTLWGSFKSRFGTPQHAQQRFGQFGKLRNAIRHSREADAVTQKDGEAAILWFEQMLGIRRPS